MMGRWIIIATVAAGACMIVLAGAGWLGGLRINVTPSEPLGLWRIARPTRPPAPGDLVFVCPPLIRATEEALARGYLRWGLCPGGVAPLIKTVVAVPGQLVEVGAAVRIDGRPLDHSGVRTVDGAGRTIIPFAGGVVPAGHLFLHSASASSYDSRYFGPVPDVGVLGLARPVLTFDP